MDGFTIQLPAVNEREARTWEWDTCPEHARLFLPSAEDCAKDDAERQFLQETLRPRLSRRHAGLKPYSLPWFLAAEQYRYAKQGAWIPRLLEFHKHDGETLLCLGAGLGTDWLQYAKQGARVIAGCANAEQMAVVRRNFSLNGLTARFVVTPMNELSLEDDSIDVVCLNGLSTVLRPETAAEIFRVLRPGGKLLALLAARRNVIFWQNLLLPWRWVVRRQVPVNQGVRCFSAKRARRFFGSFVEPRIHKRLLDRGDVPHLWRGLPLSVLERLMGRCLVLKAFKPLPMMARRRLAA